MEEFLTDVKTLRERARENIEKGPVTDAYGADLDRVMRPKSSVCSVTSVTILRPTD
jgi:bacterioferritin